MEARLYFEEARSAVLRLRQVRRLLANDGDDWRPAGGRSPQVSDPTATTALRHIKNVESLLYERDRLADVILDVQRVAMGVGEALGDKYYIVLDGYYLHAKTWQEVAGETGIPRRSCVLLRDTALDWVDMVGLARAKYGRGVAE